MQKRISLTAIGFHGIFILVSFLSLPTYAASTYSPNNPSGSYVPFTSGRSFHFCGDRILFGLAWNEQVTLVYPNGDKTMTVNQHCQYRLKTVEFEIRKSTAQSIESAHQEYNTLVTIPRSAAGKNPKAFAKILASGFTARDVHKVKSEKQIAQLRAANLVMPVLSRGEFAKKYVKDSNNIQFVNAEYNRYISNLLTQNQAMLFTAEGSLYYFSLNLSDSQLALMSQVVGAQGGGGGRGIPGGGSGGGRSSAGGGGERLPASGRATESGARFNPFFSLNTKANALQVEPVSTSLPKSMDVPLSRTQFSGADWNGFKGNYSLGPSPSRTTTVSSSRSSASGAGSSASGGSTYNPWTQGIGGNAKPASGAGSDREYFSNSNSNSGTGSSSPGSGNKSGSTSMNNSSAVSTGNNKAVPAAPSESVGPAPIDLTKVNPLLNKNVSTNVAAVNILPQSVGNGASGGTIGGCADGNWLHKAEELIAGTKGTTSGFFCSFQVHKLDKALKESYGDLTCEESMYKDLIERCGQKFKNYKNAKEDVRAYLDECTEKLNLIICEPNTKNCFADTSKKVGWSKGFTNLYRDSWKAFVLNGDNSDNITCNQIHEASQLFHEDEKYKNVYKYDSVQCPKDTAPSENVLNELIEKAKAIDHISTDVSLQRFSDLNIIKGSAGFDELLEIKKLKDKFDIYKQVFEKNYCEDTNTSQSSGAKH